MRSKRKFIICTALSLLVLGGIALFSDTSFLSLPHDAQAAPRKKPEVKASAITYVKVKVMAGDEIARKGFSQNTSLEALQRVTIYPRVTGRLAQMDVTKGMTVQVGTQLALLEHAEQNAQIVSAQAAVARTQAEMENARIELQRYQRLSKEGFSTRQQFDSKNTAFKSARAQYDAAKAELSRLTVNRDEYIIKASITGTVLNDYSRAPGAMLSTSTPVAELADLRTLKATFRIPENRFYTVHPGMYVLLTLDALPKETFRAKIVRIDDYIDSGSRTAGVEAHLDNATTNNRLRPGMFGQVFVLEKEAFDTFMVPSNAIRTGDGGVKTLVLNRNGKAQIVPIETGINEGLKVQVTKGLKNGDQVITFGGNALKDGDAVQVIEQVQ